MANQKHRTLSRREFAQRAAVLSASASLASGGVLLANPSPLAALPLPPDGETKLSPEGQVEASARFQQILSQYGERFTADEKQSLQKMCFDLQPALDRVRAFPIHNGDAPSLYLKPLVERDQKPPATPAAAPAASPKKS